VQPLSEFPLAPARKECFVPYYGQGVKRPVMISLPEPVFLNVYGAQESIPRNEFRQPMKPGGPVQKPYSYSVPSPHRLFKYSSSDIEEDKKVLRNERRKHYHAEHSH
jgi:hypothetical protein